MHAGESQLPRVPTVPKGFKRKVVLCPWVYDAALRNQEEQRSKIDRHVYYIPWDDAADKPAGNACAACHRKTVWRSTYADIRCWASRWAASVL